MKKYLAVYTGTPGGMEKWNEIPEAIRKEREAKGMKVWGAWVETHKGAIVDMGGPLSKTKRVDAKGIADIRNSLAAYTVVRAESFEAAAKMFEGHPHFTIFPGDGVEVMEILPVPGM